VPPAKLTAKQPTKPPPKPLTGGCLCGHIRFVAKGNPGKVHTCSCRMCQRHSGGLTLVWAEFARDKITWTGRGGAPARFQSSAASSRAFCPKCGSTLGAIDVKPVIALVTGSFDAPQRAELKPHRHFNRAGRPRWWHVAIDA
jgi:hypothetical protein